jgi:hypothetical protein
MRSVAKRILRAVAPAVATRLDLGRYAQDWVLPRHLEGADPSSFVPAQRAGSVGLELRPEDQLERLDRWRRTCGEMFRALREDPLINTLCPGRDHLHNGTYPTPDAEIYAAMIADFAPRRIVEIGAGFSTLIASKVTSRQGGSCEIVVVDPEPRTDVRDRVDRIDNRCVEDVASDELGLCPQTLLFIDSSHIARARGDIPHLFNSILPAAPAGVLVHVHDVFIPYDYPPFCQQHLYTEQYVLQALLAHSPRYRVLFATHYMSREHPEPMRATFGEVVARDDLYYGSSFWFRIEPVGDATPAATGP